MANEFPLPDVGEGLTEADIVSWKVAPGDEVTVNQILVEIETAKSLVELPSPQAGTVGALLVEEGQTVEVGTPIIRFGGAGDSGAEAAETMPAPHAETQAPASEGADAEGGATLVGYGAKAASSKRRPRKGAAATPAAVPAAEPAAAQAAAPAAPAPAPAEATSASAGGTGAKPLAKPPVRKLAKDLGIDLATVTATGSRGEVTRADVQAAAEGTATAAVPAASGVTASAGESGELEERIPFKGVVFNNGTLGFVEMEMKVEGLLDTWTKL